MKTTRRRAMTSLIQMFSKTVPNVFQSFQLKLSQLGCDFTKASGYGCNPCHYLSAASRHVAARTEEMACDDFSSKAPAKTHPRLLCRKHSVSKKNCLCFLNGASSNVTELNCYMGFQEGRVSECVWPDVLAFMVGF